MLCADGQTFESIGDGVSGGNSGVCEMSKASGVVRGVPESFEHGAESGGIGGLGECLDCCVEEEFEANDFLANSVVEFSGYAETFQFAGVKDFTLEKFAFGHIDYGHQNLSGSRVID